MSLQKNVLEVILSSPRTVFNVQSLRMLTECEVNGFRFNPSMLQSKD